MEHISGRSLSEIIEEAKRTRRPLEERAIATIGLPVLRGLSAVHRVDVVHRDVKPANILVADDHSIFLVDFGIAKITGDVSLTGKHDGARHPGIPRPGTAAGDPTGPAADCRRSVSLSSTRSRVTPRSCAKVPPLTPPCGRS